MRTPGRQRLRLTRPRPVDAPSLRQPPQWIFLRLFEKGLAYQAEVPVNWCPALGTVLANEEVIDGKSERGGHPVIRKPMKQWMLRITAFADRLVEDLDELEWPDGIKDMQRNWVGRSEGAQLRFEVLAGGAEGAAATGDAIEVFTTRPDTLFGATYMVLAPEHPLVAKLAAGAQKAAVEQYVEAASRKSDLERTDLAKDKTGVFTGSFARNPATGKPIPIWVADYVLGGYGSGAIMAVPAHDKRDFDFAKQFGLPVTAVVAGGAEGDAFPGEGTMVNSKNAELDINGAPRQLPLLRAPLRARSGPFLPRRPALSAVIAARAGLKNTEAAQRVIDWLKAKGIGDKKVGSRSRNLLRGCPRHATLRGPHSTRSSLVASLPRARSHHPTAPRRSGELQAQGLALRAPGTCRAPLKRLASEAGPRRCVPGAPTRWRRHLLADARAPSPPPAALLGGALPDRLQGRAGDRPPGR